MKASYLQISCGKLDTSTLATLASAAVGNAMVDIQRLGGIVCTANSSRMIDCPCLRP